MKKLLSPFLIINILLGMIITPVLAQDEQPAADSETAIQFSEIFTSIDSKIQYLMRQANRFIENGQYDQAKKIAEHILIELDSSSAQAKSILEKTTETQPLDSKT